MTMTRKRSRLEIYLDILGVVRSGVYKPTRIMYRTNLSWRPMQEMLQSLIAQGLIAVNNEKRRKNYEITEKGRTALKYFKKTKELIVVGEVKERSRQVYPL